MKEKLVSCCLFFQIVFGVCGQNKSVDLDQFFSALVNNKQFNGNILVAAKGKVIYERSTGLADFSTNRQNDAGTVFPIASLSKTLTATAILQLMEGGKLKVTDAVIAYLPTFPYPNITIQHLLSHTSGLPPYNAYFDSTRKIHPDTVFSNAVFLAGITSNSRPLLYQPGDRGNYDNINFIVLALVIEKISGMPYRDYISKNILAPAGMKQTFFMPLKDQYTQSTSLPFAYPSMYPHKYSDIVVKAKEVSFITSYWSAYNFNGFGDYVSTTHDLLKYDQAYYNNKLLRNTAILHQAFVPVKLNSGQPNVANFGWGWEIAKDSSLGKVIYHNGNATGLSCILLRNISKQQTIIIFDNVHNNNSEKLAFQVLKIINGVKLPLPKKSIAAEYAETLLKKGAAAAREQLFFLKADTTRYQLDENEMNDLGYDFMGGVNNPNPYHFPESHKYQEALATLQLNSKLFPNSWNTHDSYGEILLLLGRKEEAMQSYKRSIELNPNNTGGKKVLAELSK